MRSDAVLPVALNTGRSRVHRQSVDSSASPLRAGSHTERHGAAGFPYLRVSASQNSTEELTMPERPPMATAADFDPEVLLIFDEYVHGDIDRRTFLRRVGRFAVGGVTAVGLLGALTPRFAEAQQIAPTDDRLDGRHVEYDSPSGYGKARGYLVRPKRAAGPAPVVLVVHENRGLNPHIEDVARRVALEGFVALAPDALFPFGGYPGDEDQARALFPKLDQAKAFQDFVAGTQFLLGQPGTNGRLGVVGFCYGGAIANRLAIALPNLRAAVPFYGSAPPLEDVGKIRAELLLQFASNDERVNATWPPYEAALKAAGARYSAHVYPDTQHGFHNDTTPRYDAHAAKLAWQRTLEFFERTLRS
jgi:carboxymethylenebutenolidase